jgi:hypothetical protein
MLWELSKDILKKAIYSGNKTFDKITWSQNICKGKKNYLKGHLSWKEQVIKPILCLKGCSMRTDICHSDSNLGNWPDLTWYLCSQSIMSKQCNSKNDQTDQVFRARSVEQDPMPCLFTTNTPDVQAAQCPWNTPILPIRACFCFLLVCSINLPGFLTWKFFSVFKVKYLLKKKKKPWVKAPNFKRQNSSDPYQWLVTEGQE